MEHAFYTPDDLAERNVDPETPFYRLVVYSGLSICKQCNLAEATLTTECPGHHVRDRTARLINAGRIDFEDGVWKQQAPWLVDRPSAMPS
ncbi:hypothetical protein [Burkholderia anthina]|uniref:hypothetical protein n=1 Tax=Burkholderia anthina TaxID=179879 RepID=UPI00158B54F7|nr:hypothetical protein [Burkholderia anthina]